MRNQGRSNAILGCVALLAALQTPVSASGDDHSADVRWGETVLLVPERRPNDAPPEGPPTLPAAAEKVAPVTLHVVIRHQPEAGRPTTVKQTVTRTAERIHISSGGAREWFFQRNAKDPRRVSGFVIDHGERVILEYDESDLRNHLRIRGWADALTLGFDRSLLDGLRPTRSVRILAGMRFVRHAARGNATPAREAWWCDDQALAAAYQVVYGKARTRFTIERVALEVNAEVLRRPAERLPSYALLDLSDWLERE